MVLRSNRTIYVAIGRFPDDTRDRVHQLLTDYEREVRERDEAAILALFESAAQGSAISAARMIWEFEEQAGEHTGAYVQTGFSSDLFDIPASESLAIENHGAKLFGEELSELASRISSELKKLLNALGAQSSISGYVD